LSGAQLIYLVVVVVVVVVVVGDVDWIGLAQERDKWRALVNSIMNLRVP
jgi:hypothetical protein